MMDITDRKQAEQKMKETEERCRLIFDNSAVSISVTDSKERIINWNPYTEQLLGFKKKDIYLKHVSSLYPKEEWLKLRKQNIRKLGQRHHFETKMKTKNKGPIDVDISLSIIKDAEGNIIGSIGIIRDIIERRKAEREREEYLSELSSKTKELEKTNDELNEQKMMLERFREATVDQVLDMKKIEEENIRLKKKLNKKKKTKT
jgi:PAS domain S-box-containing protein